MNVALAQVGTQATQWEKSKFGSNKVPTAVAIVQMLCPTLEYGIF
jgi:hypothetical protein